MEKRVGGGSFGQDLASRGKYDGSKKSATAPHRVPGVEFALHGALYEYTWKEPTLELPHRLRHADYTKPGRMMCQSPASTPHKHRFSSGKILCQCRRAGDWIVCVRD